MKRSPIACAVALVATACATTGNEQYAQADCKVAPITTASATGRARPVSPIEQRWAEMQLASSDYRMRQLAERGRVNNTVEDVLHDCATR
jgi:hypothetical protein